MNNSIRHVKPLLKDGDLLQQTFTVCNAPASWEKTHSESCFGECEVYAHSKSAWLSLTIREKGLRSSKSTAFTFSKEQLVELKKLIQNISL